MYIVSACFLGENCKYDGGNNLNAKVLKLIEGHNYLPVCPEMAVGFPAPRPPAEIRGGRVYNNKGEDLTDLFREGAEKVLKEAREKALSLGEEIELALLKAKSPTCGSKRIYDGTFSHKVVDGNGVFAELLINNGIKVISEEEC
ncbi:DUF523 domain-containing protein [Bacillota bacterium]